METKYSFTKMYLATFSVCLEKKKKKEKMRKPELRGLKAAAALFLKTKQKLTNTTV